MLNLLFLKRLSTLLTIVTSLLFAVPVAASTCSQPFEETVSTQEEINSFLAIVNPQLNAQARRFVNSGVLQRFWYDPLVIDTASQLTSGEQQIVGVRTADGFAMIPRDNTRPGRIAYQMHILMKDRIAAERRPMNMFFAKMVVSLLRSASHDLQSGNVREVVINGQGVVNPELRDMLIRFGFQSNGQRREALVLTLTNP